MFDLEDRALTKTIVNRFWRIRVAVYTIAEILERSESKLEMKLQRRQTL